MAKNWKHARKKPVEVEYREVDGDVETIDTREGTLTATAGEDYIMRGVDGEIYPISQDIFEKTYERVEKAFASDGDDGSILEEALETVGERDDTHGDPVDNHEQIAEFWGEYLGVDIQPREVAEMMILVKLSRGQTGGPARDHHVDIAGYAEIASLCTDYGGSE
jgi:hypothetical protein